MLYVPNYTDSNCAYIYNNDIIRVYNTRPNSPGTYQYTDYYVNFHYNYNNGTTTFSNYSSYPTCRDNITTNFYYRNDIFEIVGLFCVVVFFHYFMISKLVKSLLHGRRTL